MNKKDREAIFNKYGGKCAYCGCGLQKRWHIDHIKPMTRYDSELDKIENKNPSCVSCNIIKSSLTLEQFRERILNFIVGFNRDLPRYRMAKRYGLIKETGNEVIFYFETLIKK